MDPCFTDTGIWTKISKCPNDKEMNKQHHKLLRLPEVKQTTGLSKSSIYARIAEGTFPKQIPLGPRLVVWVEADIHNWIAEQVSAARG